MSCAQAKDAIDAYLAEHEPRQLDPVIGHLSDCETCRKRLSALIYTEMALGERTPVLTTGIQSLLKVSGTRDSMIGISPQAHMDKRRISPLVWLLMGLSGTLLIGWTLSLTGVI